MNDIKLVSIELPTCNKDRFEKFTIGALPILASISKYCKWNINFQKQFTEDDVKKYLTVFNKYGFDVSYAFHEYTKPRGYNSIVLFREDTHQIDNTCPFIFSIDDDIEILNENYLKSFYACLYHMLVNSDVGAECIEGLTYGRNANKPLEQIDKCTYELHKYWTDGGILVRAIPSFNGRLFKEECTELLGTAQDWLLVKLRMEQGLIAYRTVCTDYKHYEIRNGDMKNAGYNQYGWYLGDKTDKRIWNYMKTLNIDLNAYHDAANKKFSYKQLSCDELIKMIDNEVTKLYEK